MAVSPLNFLNQTKNRSFLPFGTEWSYLFRGSLEQEIAKDARMAETLTIAKADVLRRAELFDQVIEEYSGKVFSEDLLNEICQFQIEKAKQKDADCYRVCDAHPGN